MREQEAIQIVEQNLGLMQGQKADNDRMEFLAEKINELLNKDFQRLVSILYRMDINESKLRALLQNNPDTDAGILIAEMMVERESQKIKTRRESSRRDNNIDEEEKW
jgi:hypothetical protein